MMEYTTTKKTNEGQLDLQYQKMGLSIILCK